MNCPLCNVRESRPSWLDRVFYHDREFQYRQCTGCGSLFCHPMPDAQTLALMYGPEYVQDFSGGAVFDPKEPLRVIHQLSTESPGTFVDYGCGEGALLAEAAKRGWTAIGIEFDDDVARRTAERTETRVVGLAEGESLGACADVLHLGDVIEHLTDLNAQMPRILQLLKPGGLLLAQGPLEGNANLFSSTVQTARRLRPARRTEMAPYHVLLATASGQRTFFKRFGLSEVQYSVSEVAWPAPARLRFADWCRPRALALFTLRKLSQGISQLQPNRWGNRYFYVGRWTPAAQCS
ncbi:MAG TPA: class I SAM-dependent methyltransferase [Pirellulales bacterium]|nr:class I SAM-dependent methyltransferase [Pirellulales bacterium]